MVNFKESQSFAATSGMRKKIAEGKPEHMQMVKLNTSLRPSLDIKQISQ
jgi:hypothetical protein